MSYTNLRTLVLNSNYQPINLFPLSLIPVHDAIVRVVNGTCTPVYDYDIKIGTRNTDREWKWPSVIARTSSNYVHREKVVMTNLTLYYRDKGICAYCQKFLERNEITVDHVIPTAKGGKNEWDNITCACERCNSEKSDSLPRGKWVPKNRVYTPSYYDILNNRKKFPLIIYDSRWMEFIPQWNSDVIVKQPYDYHRDEKVVAL